jgi:hypothetical protein
MPKGQSPSSNMAARYSLLSKQLDSMPKDYSTFSKLRRKVNEFLGTEQWSVGYESEAFFFVA